MVRFLHTSDWQLGMRRHFLAQDEQGRFSQARIDAIRTLGRAARDHDCAFVLVAGDVFESNHLDPKTVARALDALNEVSVPVYLLPGNHDPLDPASIFRRDDFQQRQPPHVHVLDGTVVSPGNGVELHSAPWRSKRPARDLVAAVCDALDPAPAGVTRILVAHGGMARFAGGHENPAFIDAEAAEAAVADGRIHYLALGDRHSATAADAAGRIRYSGAPEPTDYNETDPGKVLAVEVTPEACNVQPVETGTWRFVRTHRDIAGDDDLDALDSWLQNHPARDRAILKLSLSGTLTLDQYNRLQTIVANARHGFAAIEHDEHSNDLAMYPGGADLDAMALGGYAREAMEELVTAAQADSEDAGAAREALGLLYRLAGASA